MKYSKGDVVKVWSLQSFSNGGFLNGNEAIVSQSQIGDSVMIAVERKFGGEKKLDPRYEVYAKQLELVSRCNESILHRFHDLINDACNRSD